MIPECSIHYPLVINVNIFIILATLYKLLNLDSKLRLLLTVDNE